MVLDSVWIKQYQVCLHPLLQQATIRQSQGARRATAHHGDGCFQRQSFSVPDVSRQHSGKCAIATGVAALAAIGTDVGEFPLQQLFDIILMHGAAHDGLGGLTAVGFTPRHGLSDHVRKGLSL